MAIPTKTYTFDYFRRLTTTAEFLEMFFEDREKPSPYQIYEFFSNSINNNPNRSKFKLKFKNVIYSLMFGMRPRPVTIIETSAATQADFN